MASDDAGGQIPCNTPNDHQPVLKDVIALVEVRTKTENRSRGVEYQLEQLGAKVVSKLSPDVTHVIWKNGKKPTLERARKKGIHVVTVLWVESCKQNQEMVPESLFPVLSKDDGSPLFIPSNRRRKFMEPTDLEEDIRGSRERLAKRRKKDVPSPIKLPGRILVKDTPHRQSPTWYLPGPPFSPSLIPHTPDSMRKCLDHLSAAKNRTPSNKDQPSLGASPNCGTFDSPTSENSSPIERPHIVGSLIERLLYSDNEEASPLEKVSKRYDAEKKTAGGEGGHSLSKNLFPAGASDQQGRNCVPSSSEKTGLSRSEGSRTGGQLCSSDDESRRSSHVSPSQREAQSPQLAEEGASRKSVASLSRKKGGKKRETESPANRRRSGRSSRAGSTSISKVGSLDQMRVDSPEGVVSNAGPPGNVNWGTRQPTRISPRISQIGTSAEKEVSKPVLSRQENRNVSLEVEKGPKSRRSSRLSRGVIKCKSGIESVEDASPVYSLPAANSDESMFKDITNSHEASQEASVGTGKGGKSIDGGRLSRKPKKTTTRSEDTFLIEAGRNLEPSSEETTIRQGLHQQATSKADSEEKDVICWGDGRQLSRTSTRRSSRSKMEDVETIVLESSPEDISPQIVEKVLDRPMEEDAREGQGKGQDGCKEGGSSGDRPGSTASKKRGILKRKSVKAAETSVGKSSSPLTPEGIESISDNRPMGTSSKKKDILKKKSAKASETSVEKSSSLLEPRRIESPSDRPVGISSKKEGILKRKSVKATETSVERLSSSLEPEGKESPSDGPLGTSSKRKGILKRKTVEAVETSVEKESSSPLESENHNPCDEACVDDVQRKLSGTPGQKRLMAENDPEEGQVTKRRHKRRKLLKVSQAYEDPPSFLIEPKEIKKGGLDGGSPAEQLDSNPMAVNSSCAPGRKTEKRLSSRLKKDVSRDSQSNGADPAKPDRNSLEDFRVGNRRSTTIAEAESNEGMGNANSSQQSVGMKGSAATTVPQKKGHTTGSKTNSKKPTIVMTSMHKSEQEIVVSVIRNLGGFKITDRVSEGTTHVVTGDNRRTLNVLSAIAHGIWLVSKEWVMNSLESEQWLPEEPFEVHNTFPAARLSRQLKGQSVGGDRHLDLFSEYRDIFISDTSSPPRERLCELISLCGGTVTKTQRHADLCIGACTSLPGVVTVQEKWVLDCISEMKGQPMESYKIAD